MGAALQDPAVLHATVLDDVRYLSHHHSFQQAARRFLELQRHIERHIDACGLPADPVVQGEHDALQRLLFSCSCALSRWDDEGFDHRSGELMAVLRQHLDRLTPLDQN